jgi:hypothetical protein
MKAKIFTLIASLVLLNSCADQAKFAENLQKFNAFAKAVNTYDEARKPVVVEEKPTK